MTVSGYDVSQVVKAWADACKVNDSEEYLDRRSKSILAGQVKAKLAAGASVGSCIKAVEAFAHGRHNPAFFTEWWQVVRFEEEDRAHMERMAAIAAETEQFRWKRAGLWRGLHPEPEEPPLVGSHMDPAVFEPLARKQARSHCAICDTSEDLVRVGGRMSCRRHEPAVEDLNFWEGEHRGELR